MSRVWRISKLGARSLLLHPLRSFLTALGIIIGVGTVIYMLAIIEGKAQYTQEKIRARGANNILVKAKKPTDEGNSSQSRSRVVTYGLTHEDYRAMDNGLRTIRELVPVREVAGTIYKGEFSSDTVAYATSTDYPRITRSVLARGRWFSEIEEFQAAPVAVLGHELARKLFRYRDPLRETVRLGSKVFQVVGILAPTVSSDDKEGRVRDQAAYIPIGVVRERFGERNVKRSAGTMDMEEVELHQIVAQVADLKSVMPTGEAIKALLGKLHKKQDYVMDVPLALLEEAEAEAAADKRQFGSIAAISLLVGGIGIMNIMLASVTERTREIGVRRALGAHRRDITLQFLVETLTLAVVGGLVGIGGGFGAVFFHGNHFKEDPPPIINSTSVLLAFGISALVGVLAGLYPAVRAARMDPIRALRNE